VNSGAQGVDSGLRVHNVAHAGPICLWFNGRKGVVSWPQGVRSGPQGVDSGPQGSSSWPNSFF
jgi:hypothetical protein